MILFTIIIFVLVLGLLIFVHELGHFVMAKRAGMKVEEFGFGFPPRIFGIKRKGTIYSLNWIPLGGFVKILGEDGDSSAPDSFNSKSAFQRFLVLIAGVGMNVVLAWLLISIGLMIGLPTLIDEGQALPSSATVTEVKPTVLFVEPDSPAQQAGIKVGDAIVAINGEKMEDVKSIQDYTSAHAGEVLTYDVRRGSQRFQLEVIPRTNPPEDEGPMGVALGIVGKVSYPWYKALILGASNTFSLLVQILLAFGTIIKSIFAERSVLGSLTGPVGIAVMTRDAAVLGVSNLLYFTSVISMNLAIINALPFPALDGGRIFFLLIEKIRRKRINLTLEKYANLIGFALLILLMIWVTLRDVDRFSPQFNRLWEKITQFF